jgi:hypothetical protein
MNVLICSIIRNESKFLDKWYEQIRRTVKSMPEVTFSLSIYENDSTDDSAVRIAGYDWSFLSSYVRTSAKLNCPYFIGGKTPARTEILAFCRNQTMYNSPFLGMMDYILFVEPDTEYSHETVEKIINHEKHYGQKLDVFCGKSVHPNSDNIYDSWGTRKTPNQTDWKDEDGQTAGFEPMWSVFNCLVLYNAEPIKKGFTFGGVNNRLNIPDCDTVVICENFRANGYDKIYWDTNLKVQHFCE